MGVKTYFPFFRWAVKKLTGRWARRAYAAIILIALCLTAAARIRSYLLGRRIQAVLHGLAQIRVDQTTEEQLLKTVPCLTRSEHEWKAGGIVQRWYYTEIYNESDRLMPHFVVYSTGWSGRLAYWLGYRYMSFGARVLVWNGRVSSISYGLAKEGVVPRAAGYVVSVQSVHSFWLPYEHSFEVTSQDDESPQYRVEQREIPSLLGNGKGLYVTFTNDAPPELTKRAFQLSLGCFWGLEGCGDARDIAPGLWQDAQAIQAATLERLRAGKCPDSIIDGRMRYLPDMSVLLLEVTSSRRIMVNEGGHETEDWFTDYELKGVIRGRSFGTWKNVRFRRTIPSPMNPMQPMANQNWPQTKIGSEVLFFGNLHFDSCRFIPATPSALAIARNSTIPAKRPEDEIQHGLL
jgi:hypothetical protein